MAKGQENPEFSASGTYGNFPYNPVDGSDTYGNGPVGTEIWVPETFFKNQKMHTKVINAMSLFVFAIGGCEQNGVSLLTPVSDSVLIALSDGTFQIFQSS